MIFIVLTGVTTLAFINYKIYKNIDSIRVLHRFVKNTRQKGEIDACYYTFLIIVKTEWNKFKRCIKLK